MTTSTKKSFPLYAEQLEKILGLTKDLNEGRLFTDFGEQYHIKVQLIDSVSNEIVGEWSDEAATDDWEFAIVHEEKKQNFVTYNPGIRGAVDAAQPTQTQIKPEEMLRTNGVIQPDVTAEMQPANRPRRVETSR